jgi:two-component system alkaline phosphatase synthesis response regulator PhoP
MDVKKILIAEDDEFLRQLYSDVLRGEGYTIDVAIDGEDALRKIQAGGWDLVLLDIIMPKLSGLDVMKKAKESPQPLNQNKSVVFLTNLDKGEEIKEALLLGNGYLIKSQVTPGDLVKEVQLYLAPHGQAVN